MSRYNFPAVIPELVCDDFETSRQFYTEILGFNIVYQTPAEGFAMLERQGAYLMIDQINLGRTWISGEMQKPYGRGVNMQIRTTDIDLFYQSLILHQVPIFMAIEEKWYAREDMLLGNRQFIAQDPDGYLLRFYQDLGERPAN